MLKIINRLKPFFEDNYKRIGIREYSRLIGISPPTASTILEKFKNEGLLKREEDKQYINYFANNKNDLFINLSRIYWKQILEDSGLLSNFEKEYYNPIIILFGSLSKAEVTDNSDVDIAIFTNNKKEIDLKKIKKKIGREIQLFIFKDREDCKNRELLNNILNGFKIKGEW